MTQRTPITRDGVDAAYRFLLGRPPESEKAVEYGISAGSVETLRRWIIQGPEFAARIRRDIPHALRRWMLDEMQQAPAETAAPTPEDAPRIVFLHIEKTAGTAIRTAIEPLLGGRRLWDLDRDGRPGNAPPEELAACGMVAGHFTITDARHVPAPRRIFTVLREPRERLLSLAHYYRRHTEEGVAPRGREVMRIARGCTLEEFLAHPDPLVRGSVQNVMTCMLAGDYRPVGTDAYARPWEGPRAAISGPALLARALTNLFALDFIGFVDRLEEDRAALMAAIGLPDPGAFPRINTRDLVNARLAPQPVAEITPRVAALVDAATDLDRMLYDLARRHRGL
jgi:hypothetical protein